MQRWMLKSKLHRARVTGTALDYEGSIEVDRQLLEAGNIAVAERVQVLNVTNGERFETYTIEGKEGSVVVNGAAARLVEVGDTLIVLSYALCADDEQLEPTILLLDDRNRIMEQK